MNKKGMGVGTLLPGVIAIIVVGILLGVGIYVLSEVQKGTAIETITITNESVELVTETTGGTYVAKSTDCGARNFVIISVWNGSTNFIASPNHTFSTTGLLYVTDNNNFESGVSGVNGNVTYRYTGTTRQSTTDTCNVLTTSGTGTGGFASWIAVIVVVLAAAIVLGIVISSFGKRNSGV